MLQGRFDAISVLDFRYSDDELCTHLSERARIRIQLEVVLAIFTVHVRRGGYPTSFIDEVRTACAQVTAEEAYEAERVMKHDIRGLVSRVQGRISEPARPLVHLAATSYDVISTGVALQFRRVHKDVVMPALLRLERVLADIAFRESDTPQIGRSHLQHGEPVTFGHSIAQYVSRLGQSIQQLDLLADKLVGKCSGVMGAYNASSLLYPDAQAYEREVLAELGLEPGEISTQIVQHEPLLRYLTEIVTAGGIMANLCRDMRNLQRNEIAEVGEYFDEKNQVGSSGMPHKANPVSFENVEGMWKILMPRLMTVLMDQISEHNRDLTNSVTARTYPEMVCYLVLMAKRLASTMKKLVVRRENLERNLRLTGDQIASEPLSTILAHMGHPDAHEKVRKLSIEARKSGKGLIEIAKEDGQLQCFFLKMTPEHLAILDDPTTYMGRAAQQARDVAIHWSDLLDLNRAT